MTARCVILSEKQLNEIRSLSLDSSTFKLNRSLVLMEKIFVFKQFPAIEPISIF